MVNSGLLDAEADRNIPEEGDGVSHLGPPLSRAVSATPPNILHHTTTSNTTPTTTNHPQLHAISPIATKTEFRCGATTEEQPHTNTLYCSLPLNRVQHVLKPCHLKKKIHMCLYCDRTFVATTLRQKHVARCHSPKYNRRLSARRQIANQAAACVFCPQLDAVEDCSLRRLFEHLIADHANRYFGCLDCEERFPNAQTYRSHLTSFHAHAPDPLVQLPDVEPAIASKTKRLTKKQNNVVVQEDEDVAANAPKTKSSAVGSKKELRSRKTSVVTSKVSKGTVRVTRQQAKIVQVLNKVGKKRTTRFKPPDQLQHVAADVKDSVPAHVNPYPTLDFQYRVKKITDHSIDSIRIDSMTFDDVFDKAFFNRVKCNIQDNLIHHIDGKLFKSVESENRILSFQKGVDTQTDHVTQTVGGACEMSANAVAPISALPNTLSQFGDDIESQIEYGSKASKKKTTRNDEVHYKYFTRRKYQAILAETRQHRDLSKLDMWTQLAVKNRQYKIVNDQKTPKEMLEYTRSDEYRSRVRAEELDQILDRRGPLEDLKQEAIRTVALEKLNCSTSSESLESCLDVLGILNDLINNVLEQDPPPPPLQPAVPIVKKEQVVQAAHADGAADMPAFLNLRRVVAEADAPAQTLELTGEWARSRLYVCAACGLKLPNMKLLLDHKNVYHENVWSQHYEMVGNQGELYRHLSIPSLGKVGAIEDSTVTKCWVKSVARECSKCTRQFNSIGELHRHMLECGEDWTWMLARRKYKYRPYGSRSRKKRRGRGLTKIFHTISEKKEKKEFNRTFQGPRSKPSDAESIQRMLANLPAKRATRKLMCLKDGFPSNRKPRMKKSNLQPPLVAPQKSKTTTTKLHATTTFKRRILRSSTDSSAETTATVRRRSVRNIHKVLSSKIIRTSAPRTRSKLRSIAQFVNSDVIEIIDTDPCTSSASGANDSKENGSEAPKRITLNGNKKLPVVHLNRVKRKSEQSEGKKGKATPTPKSPKSVRERSGNVAATYGKKTRRSRSNIVQIDGSSQSESSASSSSNDEKESNEEEDECDVPDLEKQLEETTTKIDASCGMKLVLTPVLDRIVHNITASFHEDPVKSCGKVKKSRGLDDCIAMLTSKLRSKMAETPCDSAMTESDTNKIEEVAKVDGPIGKVQEELGIINSPIKELKVNKSKTRKTVEEPQIPTTIEQSKIVVPDGAALDASITKEDKQKNKMIGPQEEPLNLKISHETAALNGNVTIDVQHADVANGSIEDEVYGNSMKSRTTTESVKCFPSGRDSAKESKRVSGADTIDCSLSELISATLKGKEPHMKPKCFSKEAEIQNLFSFETPREALGESTCHSLNDVTVFGKLQAFNSLNLNAAKNNSKASIPAINQGDLRTSNRKTSVEKPIADVVNNDARAPCENIISNETSEIIKTLSKHLQVTLVDPSKHKSHENIDVVVSKLKTKKELFTIPSTVDDFNGNVKSGVRESEILDVPKAKKSTANTASNGFVTKEVTLPSTETLLNYSLFGHVERSITEKMKRDAETGEVPHRLTKDANHSSETGNFNVELLIKQSSNEATNSDVMDATSEEPKLLFNNTSSPVFEGKLTLEDDGSRMEETSSLTSEPLESLPFDEIVPIALNSKKLSRNKEHSCGAETNDVQFESSTEVLKILEKTREQIDPNVSISCVIKRDCSAATLDATTANVGKSFTAPKPRRRVRKVRVETVEDAQETKGKRKARPKRNLTLVVPDTMVGNAETQLVESSALLQGADDLKIPFEHSGSDQLVICVDTAREHENEKASQETDFSSNMASSEKKIPNDTVSLQEHSEINSTIAITDTELNNPEKVTPTDASLLFDHLLKATNDQKEHQGHPEAASNSSKENVVAGNVNNPKCEPVFDATTDSSARRRSGRTRKWATKSIEREEKVVNANADAVYAFCETDAIYPNENDAGVWKGRNKPRRKRKSENVDPSLTSAVENTVPVEDGSDDLNKSLGNMRASHSEFHIFDNCNSNYIGHNEEHLNLNVVPAQEKRASPLPPNAQTSHAHPVLNGNEMSAINKLENTNNVVDSLSTHFDKSNFPKLTTMELSETVLDLYGFQPPTEPSAIFIQPNQCVEGEGLKGGNFIVDTNNEPSIESVRTESRLDEPMELESELEGKIIQVSQTGMSPVLFDLNVKSNLFTSESSKEPEKLEEPTHCRQRKSKILAKAAIYEQNLDIFVKHDSLPFALNKRKILDETSDLVDSSSSGKENQSVQRLKKNKLGRKKPAKVDEPKEIVGDSDDDVPLAVLVGKRCEEKPVEELMAEKQQGNCKTNVLSQKEANNISELLPNIYDTLNIDKDFDASDADGKIENNYHNKSPDQVTPSRDVKEKVRATKKKPKIKRSFDPVTDIYCDICNKSFTKPNTLVNHKRTLTHIAKLSALEALEAQRNNNTATEQPDQEDNVLESSIELTTTSDVMSQQQYETEPIMAPAFNLSATHEHVKLTDIISDVLRKPIDPSINNNHFEMMTSESRRCRSLGERKSFDSDSQMFAAKTETTAAVTPPSDFEPAQLPTTPDVIVEKQISLLENIIEENRRTDAFHSVTGGLIACKNQYEEISLDSNSAGIHYDEQRMRKTLNRDEELFLECCSLLKSSSDVSDLTRKTLSKGIAVDDFDWLTRKGIAQEEQETPHYACSNQSPISNHFYDALSESESSFDDDDVVVKARTPPPRDLPMFEDISVDGEGTMTTTTTRDFDDGLSEKRDQSSSPNVESAQIPDASEFVFDESVTSDFAGLMMDQAINDRFESVNQNKKKSLQIPITDYTVPIKKKKPEDGLDSKKMITKGAMKVFEGLKVSIPKSELDMNEVLNCSPTTKRLELEVDGVCFNNKNIDDDSNPPKENNIEEIKSLVEIEIKSSELKNIGNKLGMKVTKKKFGSKFPLYKSSETQLRDIYDFEDAQDHIDDVLNDTDDSYPNYKDFKTKFTDFDDSNERLFEDAEELDEVEDENEDVVKPEEKIDVTSKSITKKKFKIMGRIFKNACKPKTPEHNGDMRDIPELENSEYVENFILTCKTAPPATDNHKLTEEEMNLIFDKLLQEDNFNKSAVNVQKPPPLTAKLPDDVTVQRDVDHVESKPKGKPAKPRPKKRARVFHGDDAEDEEFQIVNKFTKRRTSRKSTDNIINLEQELRECIGVASRKSQRKCTSGKQNVLVEYWSSDESNFDEDESRMRHNERIESPAPVAIENADVVAQQLPALFDSPVLLNREDELQHKQQEAKERKKVLVKKVKKKKSIPRTMNRTQSRSDSTGNNSAGIAVQRQKRTAVDTLYYWSSSSEDETQGLIEVKPIRDEYDDEDRPLQHGWIVGNSPKKLVTMLAQAKGKKLDAECVKEQRKRTSV